jgi:hypothetical protein
MTTLLEQKQSAMSASSHFDGQTQREYRDIYGTWYEPKRVGAAIDFLITEPTQAQSLVYERALGQAHVRAVELDDDNCLARLHTALRRQMALNASPVTLYKQYEEMVSISPMLCNAPATTTLMSTIPANLQDENIAIWEAEHQANLIANSLHVEAALNSLIDVEGLTIYDLTRLLAVSRQTVSSWRRKPLERRREAKSRKFWNLIFAWKLWVRLQPNVKFGDILRIEAESKSLLDVLRDENGTREAILGVLLGLRPLAELQNKRKDLWRQNSAGVPNQGGLI